MPVISAGQPTVSVQLPVPTPVPQKPKAPVSFRTAPQPPTPAPGPTGVPAVPRSPAPMSAVILPWSGTGPSGASKMSRRVVRYSESTNHEALARGLAALAGNDPEILASHEATRQGQPDGDHIFRGMLADLLQDHGRHEEADLLRGDGRVFVHNGTVKATPQRVEIHGRRWTSRTYGNTYHTALATVDGGPVIVTPEQYGYGDHYIQTAMEALEAGGHVPLRERYDYGGREATWQWAQRHGVIFHTTVADVRRERDLHRPDRLSRRVVRFAAKKPVANVNREILFPEEVRAVDVAKGDTVVRINKGVKQGLADKPGVLPGVGELSALAEMGHAATGGYENQYRDVTRLLNDPDDANRWVTLNAILSPQEAWVGHSSAALEALARWHVAGRPTDMPSLDRVFGTSRWAINSKGHGSWKWNRDGTFVGSKLTNGAKINAIKRYLSKEYPGGVRWGDISEGSYKTPNFGLAFVDRRGTALDTHMARLLTPGGKFTQSKLWELAAGVGANKSTMKSLKKVRDSLITKTPIHIAYKTLIGHTADRTGYDQREVQEAVWTSIIAIIVAKHMGAGPDAKSILSKLSNSAIRAGWSLESVLRDRNVGKKSIHSLEALGVPSQRIEDVLGEQARAGNVEGTPRTSDPAALESAARRIGGDPPDAADAIIARLRNARPAASPVRYMRTEVDHEPFHAKIAENPRQDTPPLVYADFLEENDMPHLAAFIREVVRSRGDYTNPNRTAMIMHYTYRPQPPHGATAHNAVFNYFGLGWFRSHGRGRPRPPETTQVSVQSPYNEERGGYLSFNLDVPVPEARQWTRRLLDEGHPAGNL